MSYKFYGYHLNHNPLFKKGDVNYSEKYLNHILLEQKRLESEIDDLKLKLNKEKICYNWCRNTFIGYVILLSVFLYLSSDNKIDDSTVNTFLESSIYPITALIIGMIINYHDGIKDLLNRAAQRLIPVDQPTDQKVKKSKTK